MRDSHWIKVADTLPDYDLQVLVYVPGDLPDMVVAYYREGPDGAYWDHADAALSDITGIMEPAPTHWRLKPATPQD